MVRVLWSQEGGFRAKEDEERGSQIPADTLTRQLSLSGCPAGTIIGQRVFAILLLSGCCVATIDI